MKKDERQVNQEIAKMLAKFDQTEAAVMGTIVPLSVRMYRELIDGELDSSAATAITLHIITILFGVSK